MKKAKKVLFLNPPSFGRFDSAGARFQATRKTKSMWYPVWLCYAAGVIENGKVLDCPAEGIEIDAMLETAREFDIVVAYTSTPSIENDVVVAEKIKEQQDSFVVFVGPHVSTLPEETLSISDSIDAVVRGEFEYPILELSQGKDPKNIKGLSWRNNGKVIHNPNRQPIRDLDSLPFVSSVYRRDLPIDKYHLPFALRPYISIYTGRGCPNRCTFCLWPQTFTGREYRTRSIQNVIEEVEYVKNEMPEVREIFFDDDTFTIDVARVEEFCENIKSLGVTWSCNARADLKYETLKKMKEARCRLLVVGYESGNQNILNNVKKGITLKQMKEFTKNSKGVGLMIHGTFVIGLPGETKETIEESIKFACDLDLDTIQVSVASPLPGTEFYNYCESSGYIKKGGHTNLKGYQSCIIEYPDLSSSEILEAVERFHIRYFYRPSYILKQLKKALSSKSEAKRILSSGLEFQKYVLRNRLLKREVQKEGVYTKEEEEEIKERLQRIGYV